MKWHFRTIRNIQGTKKSVFSQLQGLFPIKIPFFGLSHIYCVSDGILRRPDFKWLKNQLSI